MQPLPVVPGSPAAAAAAANRAHKGETRLAMQEARRLRRELRLTDQRLVQRAGTTPARVMMRDAGLAAAYSPIGDPT